MKKKRNSLCIIMMILLLLVSTLSGCGDEGGAKFDQDYGSAENSGMSGDSIFEENSKDKETSDGKNDTSSGEYVERKIVYTVMTELQTKDFDAAMDTLQKGIQSNGGYIQSQKQTDDGGINSKYSRRTLTMVVRVPSKNLETFLSGLKNDNMHTLSLSKDSKDLTTVYYDKEIRIESLKLQEERLLEMLSKATDLQTMLELEDRLADVRYEIETFTKELNVIDADVAYSTVTIYMNEVVEYIETVEEPASFGERIVEAFKESWKGFYDGVQNFVVWIVYALPTLLVMAVIVVAFVLLIIKLRKRTKEKYLSGQNTPDTKNSENSQNPYDNITV